MIADKRDYPMRAIKADRNEVSSPADEFNHMLEQIQTQKRALQKALFEVQKKMDSFLDVKAELLNVTGPLLMASDMSEMISHLNKPAMEIYDWTTEEAIGKSFLAKVELVKKDITEGLTGLDQLMNTGNGTDILGSFIRDRNIERYKKREIVYSEGNRPSRLYYIQKGKVKTYKTNCLGKELAVGLYTGGEFMGYSAIIEDAAYKETAVAMEETVITIIPKEDFEELIYNSKVMARKFMKLLAKDAIEREEQLLGLAYNSVRKKVADALVALQKKYNPGNITGLSIDMSRENLASIAGIATESLIRTLSDFRKEKLIDITHRSIIVLEEKKLSYILN